MAEPRFADDDDLPRTLRRERDARERDARERELREREIPAPPPDDVGYAGATGKGFAAKPFGYDYSPSASGGGSVTVTRLRIPFLHLSLFFMKAVVAAIPAMLLLTVLLWIAGQGLKLAFPDLRHFEIVVKAVK
ncbi:MAG: hypothetical protein SFW09_03010 [Hyphomicrobiaceae bacterium]|nr:hypothetical protein [Hyphomicrobiaceae bacterium]